MSVIAELDGNLQSLATALGVLKPTGANLALDASFFADPLGKISAILSNGRQRAALVRALEGFLLPDQTSLSAVLPEGVTRTAYPLLERAPGQIYVVLEREGPAETAALTVSVAAEVAAANRGPAVTAQFALVRATGNDVRAVAASPEYPLRVSASAPLGASVRIAAEVLLVAPPHERESRFALQLDGLSGRSEPLVLDLASGAPPLGALATALLQLGFSLADTTASPELARVAEALPVLLGLEPPLDPLPISQLLRDAGSFRAWFARLADVQSTDGRSALVVWFDALGTLFGRSLLAPAPLATEDDPIVIPLLADSAAPALHLLAWLSAARDSGQRMLLLGLRTELAGGPVDAALRVEATLLSLPLTGTAPVEVLPQLDIAVRAPASGNALVTESAGQTQLAVRSFRGGMRYERSAVAQIVPLLELFGVRASFAAENLDFERLDLTDAHALSSAARQTLEAALRAGLGEVGSIANALRRLLGLGTDPGIDLARLATAPARAIAAYYRALAARPDGLRDIAGSVAALLGSEDAPVAGTGTRLDPWSARLTQFAAPAASPISLHVVLWNEGDADVLRLRVGLRAQAEPAGCSVAGQLQLLAFDLAASSGEARFLGDLSVSARFTPPAVGLSLGGVALGASAIESEARFEPSSGLTLRATLSDVSLSAGSETLELGDWHFPWSGFDATRADLGLGLEPQKLWSALLQLVARAAGSWAGPEARALLSLIGVRVPSSEAAASMPALGDELSHDLASLLEDPLEAVRSWIQALALRAMDELGEGVLPNVPALLEVAQALLTNRVLPSGTALETPARPVYGSGTADDPWAAPLHEQRAAGAELLVWLEPDGPPIQWSALALGPLAAARSDITAVLTAAHFLGGCSDSIAAALVARDLRASSDALKVLESVLADGDGLLSLAAATPADPAWNVAPAIQAAHDQLPAHADTVSLVRSYLDVHTQGLASDAFSVLLLAPPFIASDRWEPLLESVPAAARARIDLRSSTAAPSQVDLRGTPAAAFYVVDLADDGIGSLAGASDALGRVIDSILRVKPASRVVLVAHSYAADVACEYAAQHAANLLGLVTIGAPLGESTVSVDQPQVAEAVRVARALAPTGFAAGPSALNDALGLLERLLDGYRTAPGLVPRPQPWSSKAFRRRQAAITLPAGLPVLAIVGDIAGDLREALSATLGSIVSAAATRDTPTHLAWGIRTPLALPAAAEGDPAVEVRLRLELGRLALAPGLASTRPRWLEVEAEISRPGAYLLGSAGTGEPQATRVRCARISAVLRADVARPELAFDVRLFDTAFLGARAPWLELEDPATLPLFSALLCELDRIARAGGRLDALLDLLGECGVLQRATSTKPTAVLADGLRELRTNGIHKLASVLPPLLDREAGLLGLKRAAGAADGGGPWQLELGAPALTLAVQSSPWSVRLRTNEAGLALGPAIRLHVDSSVPLGDLRALTAAQLLVLGMQLQLDRDAGTLELRSAMLERPLTLYPGVANETRDALAAAVPRVLVASALTALIEQSLDGEIAVAALEAALRNPAAWLSRAGGLGSGALPEAEKVRTLLRAVAELASLVSDAESPLTLPGGLRLDARDAGTPADPRLELVLRSGDDIEIPLSAGNVAKLALDVGLQLDGRREVSPSGALSLRLPLPETPWTELTLRFAVDASGLAMSLTTASGVSVTLLPALSGLETLLAGSAEQLLAQILDLLVARLSDPQPSAALGEVLAVAEQLGIYDSAAPAAGFAAKASSLARFVDDLAHGRLAPLASGIAAACTTLLQRVLGNELVPAVQAEAPGMVEVRVANVLGGRLAIAADFAEQPPAVRFAASALELGPTLISLDLGFSAGALRAITELGATLDTGLGLSFTPKLKTGVDTSSGVRLSVEFDPLGDGTLALQLAPRPALPPANAVLELARAWVLPLGGTLLLRAAHDVLQVPLWAGATRTIHDALLLAGLATAAEGGQLSLATPLPHPAYVLRGLLDALAGQPVPLPGGFSALVVNQPKYGLAFRGQTPFSLGDYALALQLGLPDALDAGWGDAGRGVGVLLLDLSDPNAPKLTPALRLGGLGVRLERSAAGKALIDASGFRLGRVAAYVQADIALLGAGAPKLDGEIHGAVVLEDLGLIIGAGESNENPVAGSLLQSGGSGDSAPANPPFNLLVGSSSTGYVVRFNGEAAVRIEVRRSFGPLHIDEIALLYRTQPNGPGEVGVSIDGGVALAGLTLQAEDLALYVPLRAPSDLSQWHVDLAGLALSFDNPSVKISGGLLKAEQDGIIDYRGALAVEVSGYGLSALGAYSRPNDALGSYTSLFVFLALSAPLGGPPYLFIIGLAGGVGYNRRLLAPRDPASVTSFPLVRAMIGGSSTDPMEALKAIGRDIQPSRGAFWLAAGVRFTTFELLRTTALVTVAIDRGLEVNLLGLMQLALPPGEETVVSLELALAARYSSVDKILSIRAALTENSWLLSRDCQLTGGFAFIIWFGDRPDVLLSIGGYSRKFLKPDHYPDVPRVGFHWNVGHGIVVKGESFFALTPAALMLGGGLEAAYDVAPIRVWFSAGLDVLVFWDPFHYDADAHISVGARFSIKICFFACVRISVSVTLGAALQLIGPPLHGKVRVDLAIASVTVQFGRHAPQAYLSWEDVLVKYISGGEPKRPGTVSGVLTGALASGAQPDGSETAPFCVVPEFTLRVETKLPSTGYRLGGAALNKPAYAPDAIDVVPSDPDQFRIAGALMIRIARREVNGYRDLDAQELSLLDVRDVKAFFPAAVWDSAAASGGADAMLPALGSVELSAAVSVSERTNRLGDVSISELIEEEAPLPLPFPEPRSLRSQRRRLRSDVRAEGPQPVVRSAEPQLRLVRTLGPAFARAAPAKPQARSVSELRLLGHALPQGHTQVWNVDATSEHELTASRAPVRVTALSGAGAVLVDKCARRGRVRVPKGTQKVLVSDGPSAEDSMRGWELGTPLLLVGPSTALARLASVHLPRPWVPPLHYGRSGEVRFVPPAALCLELDCLTTRFAPAPDLPRVVVVRVDRTQSRARIDKVRVDAPHATLSEPRVVSRGSRTELVFAVRSVENPTGDLVVRVECGKGFRLAGVLGLDGTPSVWARKLERAPDTRFHPHGARSSARRSDAQVTLRRAATARRTR